MTSPGKQRLSLADNPVLPAIQVDCDNARYGRLGGDQGCDGGGGGNLLVEKRNADGCAPERLKEREGRQGVFRLAIQADQGAATGEEGLRRGEGDGEEGEGRADDLEVCV